MVGTKCATCERNDSPADTRKCALMLTFRGTCCSCVCVWCVMLPAEFKSAAGSLAEKTTRRYYQRAADALRITAEAIPLKAQSIPSVRHAVPASSSSWPRFCLFESRLRLASPRDLRPCAQHHTLSSGAMLCRSASLRRCHNALHHAKEQVEPFLRRAVCALHRPVRPEAESAARNNE
jgi:hypothetical protein